jgi:hypothetical protein
MVESFQKRSHEFPMITLLVWRDAHSADGVIQLSVLFIIHIIILIIILINILITSSLFIHWTISIGIWNWGRFTVWSVKRVRSWKRAVCARYNQATSSYSDVTPHQAPPKEILQTKKNFKKKLKKNWSQSTKNKAKTTKCISARSIIIWSSMNKNKSTFSGLPGWYTQYNISDVHI